MSKPSKISDVLQDFTIYDVTLTCRGCDTEYAGKAFTPADGTKRWGTCPSCDAVQNAPQLPPPKKDVDLRPPRRTWEPE